MYDSNFINLIKDKVVLSDVIGKTVRILNKGRNKVACCPFHKEKTPSFYISDEKGVYHCFGCGAHGNVINFIMQQEGLSFKEAIEKLAKDNGITLPSKIKNSTNKQEVDKINIIYDINEKTCNFFQNCIFSDIGINGLNYIKKRGLNNENIKKFKIGFAPQGFNNLRNYLSKFNYSDKQMEMAGVLTKNENGYYDKFRNRIIFPVFDKVGKIIAFTGRVVNKNDIPKYMNSPETLLYHKSDVLFNYFFARKSIYDKKCAILVEGNIDAIMLSINGIENVVAPMGTAITIKQIEELWKITNEIIVCLDGDSAGQKASLRLANLVLPTLSQTKSIKFVLLPSEQDPDDFIKINGKSGFITYIQNRNNCIPLSEFLWKNELKTIDFSQDKKYITPEEKGILENKISTIVKQIVNPVVSKNFENFYKNQLFLISKFDKNNKISNYRNLTKINYRQNIIPINSIDSLKQNILNIENKMFCIMINYLQVVDQIFQLYNVDMLNMNYTNPISNKIIDIFIKMYETNNIENKKMLIENLEKNNLNDYIIRSNVYNNIVENKKVKYLYGLVLERNINLLGIEAKNLSIENNNENRRKSIIEELEILQIKKNEIDEEF